MTFPPTTFEMFPHYDISPYNICSTWDFHKKNKICLDTCSQEISTISMYPFFPFQVRQNGYSPEPNMKTLCSDNWLYFKQSSDFLNPMYDS